MCGIAGYIGRVPLAPPIVSRTLELMRNRGPDHSAHRIYSVAAHSVAFLHTRLSIIDLDPRSHQPFESGTSSLIFNGEIYNYLELRKDLESKGYQFRTGSDTEVLLEAYHEYGSDCVERFEGMWSFALLDQKKKCIILSRDRFGEKPLYLHEDQNGIAFASEVKFLSSLADQKFQINEEHVCRYLVNGYKSLYKQPATFFNSVTELPASNVVTLEFCSDGTLKKAGKRYWNLNFQESGMNIPQAVEQARDLLTESMRLRLRSDVPLAFCLSGGVDSGSLASVAAKQFNYDVACYSIIDPDERYNELDNINAVVSDLGCRSHQIELSREKSFDRLKKVIAYHDAPIATITYYVHSMLSEAIARDGYKVVFSGTSADELFTGYYDHFNLFLYEMRDHPNYQNSLNDWQKHIRPVVRNPHLQNPNLYIENPDFREHLYLNNDIFASYLKRPFRENFSEERFCDGLLRNRMINELLVEATPVILHEDDLNSMLYSLENRSPFLDSKLVEFAYTIPTSILIGDGYGKFILREAMKGILADKVRLDRRKKGFNASIESVFDLGFKELRDFLLDQSPIYEIIERRRIEEVLSKTPLDDSFNKFLFSFISAKLFYEAHC